MQLRNGRFVFIDYQKSVCQPKDKRIKAVVNISTKNILRRQEK